MAILWPLFMKFRNLVSKALGTAAQRQACDLKFFDDYFFIFLDVTIMSTAEEVASDSFSGAAFQHIH